MVMRLSALLNGLPSYELIGEADVEITGMAHDSRRVRAGDLFVAIRGLEADGHDYIGQALAQGAAAIVGEREHSELSIRGVEPYIRVSDSREALALLAAAFHGYPARQMRIIGVTGTDGKTTTVSLIHHILTAAGYKTGFISTVNANLGDEICDTGLHTTTPDALEVQAYLARMAAAGVQYAVLESTSHGLAQHRVTACDYDVAVVTNITHEHLDYHGSYEAYREAKARLFRSLGTGYRKSGVPKVAVLNADDSSFVFLRTIPCDRQITYGLETPDVDVKAEEIITEPRGQRLLVTTPHGDIPLATPLIGRFNVYNVLAAVAVGLSQDIPVEAIQDGVAAMSGVPGRMEFIDEGQPFTAVVDFAHTPYALAHALETVRAQTKGRVIVVFGCAGRRDKTKRPLMGEIAGRLADKIIITAEDPRTESLSEIMAQVAAGCERAGRRLNQDYWQIGDRGAAIQFAVDQARPGDWVLVTGKGHEQSMCFGTIEYPWDDRQAVREALRRVRG